MANLTACGVLVVAYGFLVCSVAICTDDGKGRILRRDLKGQSSGSIPRPKEHGTWPGTAPTSGPPSAPTKTGPTTRSSNSRYRMIIIRPRGEPATAPGKRKWVRYPPISGLPPARCGAAHCFLPVIPHSSFLNGSGSALRKSTQVN